MTPPRLVAFSAAIAMTIAVAHAQAPRDSLVVPAAWVAQHIKDANLVLLHVGDRGEYDAGHLPGARLVELSQIAVTDRTGSGLSLEMLPADTLRERLAALGISDSSRIVVYYGAPQRVTTATRVIATLDHAGLGSATSLLDGGMPAWVRAGHATSTEVPPARSGALSPLKINPIVVDAEFVKAHLKTPGYAIVDARTPAFYSGAQTGGSQAAPHKTGHIAGAVNIPYSELTDAQGMTKGADAIAKAFADAGVKPGDTVVTYCHIGQQATATLFAARTLGFKVLLYDGSFEDWSKRDGVVEK
jgi:thiosulfate/3-mercaptopyruvate sulfurtransferase